MPGVPRDLKPKIDGILSEEKYIQRSLDNIARLLDEEPADILRFCRESTDYNLSSFKQTVYIALRERVNEVAAKEEEALKEAMEATEEGEADEELGVARLHPLPKPTLRAKTPWSSIQGNVSHCHIILSRTLRMIPGGEHKILLGQTVRDLESLYVLLSKEANLKLD